MNDVTACEITPACTGETVSEALLTTTKHKNVKITTKKMRNSTQISCEGARAVCTWFRQFVFIFTSLQSSLPHGFTQRCEDMVLLHAVEANAGYTNTAKLEEVQHVGRLLRRPGCRRGKETNQTAGEAKLCCIVT
ncbi:hypothetical protein MHYP_G00271090 [Metynnis hypsauchen]